MTMSQVTHPKLQKFGCWSDTRIDKIVIIHVKSNGKIKRIMKNSLSSSDTHPVLTELNIDPSMCVAILSHLLHNQIISRTMIQDALQQHIHTSPQQPTQEYDEGCNDTSNSACHKKSKPQKEKRKETQSLSPIPSSRDHEKPNATTKAVDTIATTFGTTTTSVAATANTARTRHIALHVYYDGGSYSGLAENIGQMNDTSIERSVFAALIKANFVTCTTREHCQYSRCGRTDKGVSACGQMIALQLKSAFPIEATKRNPNDDDGNGKHGADDSYNNKIDNDELPKNSFESRTVWVPPRKNRSINGSNNDDSPVIIYTQKCIKEYAYDKILNNLLPPDIRILGWCPVSANFSARFSCTTRTYRYFFIAPKQHHQQQQHAEDCCTSTSYRTTGRLSIDRMKQGLQHMIGTHDFRNFCKMDVEKVYNFVRTIHTADIVIEASTFQNDVDICFLHIVGQAFLWHQIRCIVHVLFLIGRSSANE